MIFSLLLLRSDILRGPELFAPTRDPKTIQRKAVCEWRAGEKGRRLAAFRRQKSVKHRHCFGIASVGLLL